MHSVLTLGPSKSYSWMRGWAGESSLTCLTVESPQELVLETKEENSPETGRKWTCYSVVGKVKRKAGKGWTGQAEQGQAVRVRKQSLC